jgi:methyl-accepting chemotaxis protein
MGNRREQDRLPCDLHVTFVSGQSLIAGHVVDISEGGMLVKTDSETNLATGLRVDVKIEGLGKCTALIVGRSMIGLHLKWLDPPPDFTAALHELLAEIREDHADLITAVIETAERVAKAMEAAINKGLLTIETLFDTKYEQIENTDPAQYRTAALAVLETLLPPILNPVLASNPKIVFCAALDRNAWIPVHNPEYSQPQRPGEYEWNVAHSRNLRIFDDRAGLAAARNIRPSLIQIYNRDLGNDTFVLMKEVDAPIRVFGRHWGGLRVAYKR